MKFRLTRHLMAHSVWPRVHLSITTIVIFLVSRICIKCGLFHRKLHVQGKFLLNSLECPCPSPDAPALETKGSLQNLPEAVAGVRQVEGLLVPACLCRLQILQCCKERELLQCC